MYCISHVPFCKGAILEYVQYEQFTKKTAKLQHRRKGINKNPFKIIISRKLKETTSKRRHPGGGKEKIWKRPFNSENTPIQNKPKYEKVVLYFFLFEYKEKEKKRETATTTIKTNNPKSNPSYYDLKKQQGKEKLNN